MSAQQRLVMQQIGLSFMRNYSGTDSSAFRRRSKRAPE